ncbi:stage III sporulation protein AD [Pasteuria penetrans]|uniref:stage III sporulation protein AD n=1 Tax=Pasteuria penetrans TaxID=86005 RepID=UPI000FA02DEF|nr:stage III sporulation protein AD [Pasteuria penetrans]
MEIIQLVGFTLIATFLVLLLKEHRPIFAIALSLFVGISIFLLLSQKIHDVVTVLQQLTQKANIEPQLVVPVLKIIGIAYIAEFGAQIARDAGQETLASKVELAGKVFILLLAIPILLLIIETVLRVLPW